MKSIIWGAFGVAPLAVVCALVACQGGGSDATPEAAGTSTQALTPAAAPDLQLEVRTPLCGDALVDDLLEVKNTGTTAVRLSDISIEMWADDTSGHPLASEVLIGGHVGGAPGCDHDVWPVRARTQAFAPACGDDSTHQANWEITVSTADDALLPPGATWSGIDAVIHRADLGRFSPGTGDWYSGCVAGQAYEPTAHYALYVHGALVTASTGVPPSCRAPHGTQTLGNHVAGGQGNVPVVGPLPAATPMTLTLSLPLTNQAALAAAIEQVYDPGSPQYHQYLTPAQFGAAYGASQADYDALQDYVQARGLTVARTYGSRAQLAVSGTAAQVESAFFVTLNQYRRPDGTIYHAPANEPSADLSAPLLHISGLENATQPIAADARGGTSPYYCSPTTLANRGQALPADAIEAYAGRDLANVYFPCNAALPTPLDGTGQTVGLFELGTTYPNDLFDYVSQAIGGFPGFTGAPSVTVVPVGPPSPAPVPPLPTLSGTCAGAPTFLNATVSGQPVADPSNCQTSGLQTTGLVPTGGAVPNQAPAFGGVNEAQEVTLDVQMVASIAPKASITIYAQSRYVLDGSGKSVVNFEPNAILAAMADDASVSVFSISYYWHLHAGFNPAVGQLFQQFAAQGQSVLVSSGDWGADVPGSPEPNVGEPLIDSALITAVGGTRLSTTGTAAAGSLAYASETTWNDLLDRAGSGCVNVAPYTDGQGNLAYCNSVSSGGACGGYSVTDTDGTRASFPALALPSYQQSLPAAYGASAIPLNPQVSGTERMIPDVSMAADALSNFAPLVVQSSPATGTVNLPDGGTTTVTEESQYQVYDPVLRPCSGGTSASSPLWAGVLALKNQQLAGAGQGPIGFANPTLYALAAASGASYASTFHDVADGSNNSYPGNATPNPVVYTAQPGYDLTSGLGTPACGLLGMTCITCGGAACLSLDTDPHNCGACGNDCGGVVCVGGACSAAVKLADLAGEYYPDVVSDGTKVYWLDNDFASYPSIDVAIYSLPAGGGPAPTKVASLADLGRFLVQDATSLYYNVDESGAGGGMFRVSKSGGAPVALFPIPGDPVPQTFDVVADANNLYFATSNLLYQWSKTAGAGPVVVGPTIDLPSSYWSVAVDAANIYYTSNAGIENDGLDALVVNKLPIGGGPVTVLSTGTAWAVAGLYGHSLASDGSYVYFTQAAGFVSGNGFVNRGEIDRVPVDGGPVTPLATITGGYPVAIAIDGTNLYFATAMDASDPASGEPVETLQGEVAKVPLAGGPTSVLAFGHTGQNLAVDGSSVYWAAPGTDSLPATGALYRVAK